MYLGELHPDYLLNKLTARQWAGWLAYLRIYPLPHDRADFNTACSRATAMSAAGAKNVKPHKLIPQYGKITRVRSSQELKGIAMSMVTATKGKK